MMVRVQLPRQPHPPDRDCAIAIADHGARLAAVEERGGVDPQVALDGAVPRQVFIDLGELGQNG